MLPPEAPVLAGEAGFDVDAAARGLALAAPPLAGLTRALRALRRSPACRRRPCKLLLSGKVGFADHLFCLRRLSNKFAGAPSRGLTRALRALRRSPTCRRRPCKLLLSGKVGFADHLFCLRRLSNKFAGATNKKAVNFFTAFPDIFSLRKGGDSNP